MGLLAPYRRDGLGLTIKGVAPREEAFLMDAPTIHYDRMMGIHPAWRHALGEALRGRMDSFDQEVRTLSGFSPSGVQSIAASLSYARCGQQTFCVGPKLQKMLSDTGCDRVPEQFFRMPYPCFYVATPGSKWLLYGDDHTGMHRVGGFYMHQITPHEVVFFMWGLENERSRMAGDDATFWIGLDLTKVPRTTDPDGTVLMDFESYITDLLKDASHGVHDMFLDIPTANLQVAVRDVPALVCLGVNLVLYLNSLRAEVLRDESRKQHALARRHAIKAKLGHTKSSKKMAKRQRHAETELASLSEAVIIWIGKSIEEAPEPTATGNTGRPATWKSRRGHWHHYWTGPRKNPDGSPRVDPTGRKMYGDALVLKWVLPVYRDMADLVAARGHQYRFKEEKQDWNGH